MKTDREKAIEYLQKHSPGDHITAKDLGVNIGRKKSETLRVINWLCEAGFVKRIGSGPSTCYLVEHHPSIFEAPSGPSAVVSISKDEDFLDGDYPMDLEQSAKKILGEELDQLQRDLDTETIQGLTAKPTLRTDDEKLKEAVYKTNKNLAQKYFVLTTRIHEELDKVKRYITHTKDFHDNLRIGGRPDLVDPALLLKLEGEQRILESLERMIYE